MEYKKSSGKPCSFLLFVKVHECSLRNSDIRSI